MENTDQPDNVTPITERQDDAPVAPPFTFNFPPHPRPVHVQKVLDQFEMMPAEKKEELVEILEEFYAGLYYAAGGNMEAPPIPQALADLSPELRGIFQMTISPEFKKFHFGLGWNTLTDEEKAPILKAQRDKNITKGIYDHIPTGGAMGPDGVFYTAAQMQDMVDAGHLAPNPLAQVKPRLPNIDTSKNILTFEKAPNGIITP
jgi:NADPH-dependent 2,4-dienoyl-CoA reductase/sulfur reductase-like enzyme